ELPLGVSHGIHARILIKQGDFDGAESAMRRALAVAGRRVLKSTPLGRRLGINLQTETLPGTLAEAVDVLDELTAIYSDRISWQFQAAGAYERIGDILLHRGEIEAAELSYRRALETRTKLEKEGTTSRRFSLRKFDDLLTLGQIAELRAMREDAVAYYARAEALARKSLRQANRNDVKWQEAMVRVCLLKGNLLL